jgi:hypothetical protein
LLYDLFSLSYNIRIIKLRSMKWASYVQICNESKVHIKFYWNNLKEKNARIIL